MRSDHPPTFPDDEIRYQTIRLLTYLRHRLVRRHTQSSVWDPTQSAVWDGGENIWTALFGRREVA